MQARYHITERDYVRATTLHARPAPFQWAVVATAMIGWILIMGVMSHDWTSVYGDFAGLAVVLLVFRFIIFPLSLRRNYRQNKMLHHEITVALLDEGVQFTAPDGSALLLWKNIFKWRCNDDYVLIYQMPRLFHLVPGSVAAQGFDMARLKAALTQNVGAAK
jgi:hypothetical protein